MHVISYLGGGWRRRRVGDTITALHRGVGGLEPAVPSPSLGAQPYARRRQLLQQLQRTNGASMPPSCSGLGLHPIP